MKKILLSLMFVFAGVTTVMANGHTVTITATNPTCNGFSDGTAKAIVSGGVGPFSFHWNDALQQADTLAVGLPAGTYSIVVTDSSDMSIATSTTSIVDPNTIVIQSNSTSICQGQTASLIAFAMSGTTFSWSAGALTTGLNTAVATPVTTTTYTVTGTLNGCSGTAISTVVVFPTPSPNFTIVPDSTNSLTTWCFNTTNGSGLTYYWDFGDSTTSTLANPTHTYSSLGSYNVSLTIGFTPNGCFRTLIKNIVVSGTLNPCLSLFHITHDTSTTDHHAYTVYNLSYGSSLSYFWDFGDGSSSTLQNPTHVYAGTGAYQLCLTVNNGSGCTQTFCDSLSWVDSIGRSSSQLSINVVDVNGSQTAGIEDKLNDSKIIVSPNPFSESATFLIQSEKMNEKYSFELIDFLGKKVKIINNISEKQFTISRNVLKNGIYFYKIYTPESVVGIGKLVIE
jgi:PKD repeat protein